MVTDLRKKIFTVSGEKEFNELAMEVFFYQSENNPVYRDYLNSLNRTKKPPVDHTRISFLPIEFFRSQKIITGNCEAEMLFASSGTTGSVKSYHHITDLSVYEKSAIRSFEKFYGNISEYTFLALLPSYLERSDSSLVWMAKLFMSKSNYRSDCGFYLNNHEELLNKLIQLAKESSRKVVLLGVSFALLALSEKIDFPLGHIIVMETGGMKGRQKEITREELHKTLCERFQVEKIHSEYGMTEMLSQAYSTGEGIYHGPPWMKILIRETNDPFSWAATGKTGGINIIDLANINSCSFMATQDLGKLHNDGSFEVLGRFDDSDVRGCSLLVS